MLDEWQTVGQILSFKIAPQPPLFPFHTLKKGAKSTVISIGGVPLLLKAMFTSCQRYNNKKNVIYVIFYYSLVHCSTSLSGQMRSIPRTFTQGGVGKVSRSIRIALITMSEFPEVNFSINFTIKYRNMFN